MVESSQKWLLGVRFVNGIHTQGEFAFYSLNSNGIQSDSS